MTLENFILYPLSAHVKYFVAFLRNRRAIVRAQTLEDVMRPYLHLPKTIQNAILRVETHPTFRSITKASLKVLKALVTRACESNGEREIRARIDRISEEALVSTKTVQRAMAAIKKLGWINSVTDGRSEYGVFCSRRYAFTAEFCSLVELPTKNKHARLITHETEMSDGPIYVDLNFKKDQREISFQNRDQNQIDLPKALQLMAKETMIKETGIAKLRGIAYSIGHKLEDVYEVSRSLLIKHGATGGRAYRYILAMLHNPKSTDFASRAAQQQRLTSEVTALTLNKERAEKYKGKQFTVSPGITLTVLPEEARLYANQEIIKIIPWRDIGSVFDDIEDEKFVEIIGGNANPDVKQVSRKPVAIQLAERHAELEAELVKELQAKVMPQGSEANIAAVRVLLKKKRHANFGEDIKHPKEELNVEMEAKEAPHAASSNITTALAILKNKVPARLC